MSRSWVEVTTRIKSYSRYFSVYSSNPGNSKWRVQVSLHFAKRLTLLTHFQTKIHLNRCAYSRYNLKYLSILLLFIWFYLAVTSIGCQLWGYVWSLTRVNFANWWFQCFYYSRLHGGLRRWFWLGTWARRSSFGRTRHCRSGTARSLEFFFIIAMSVEPPHTAWYW